MNARERLANAKRLRVRVLMWRDESRACGCTTPCADCRERAGWILRTEKRIDALEAMRAEDWR